MNYKKLYEQAWMKTKGEYKGYTDGNALSLFVYEKHNVNAAGNYAAHDALVEVIREQVSQNQGF